MLVSNKFSVCGIPISRAAVTLLRHCLLSLFLVLEFGALNHRIGLFDDFEGGGRVAAAKDGEVRELFLHIIRYACDAGSRFRLLGDFEGAKFVVG